MYMLLEVWIFGGKVSKIRRFVFVPVPGMHGLIQSHDQGAGFRGGKRDVSMNQFTATTGTQYWTELCFGAEVDFKTANRVNISIWNFATQHG